MGQRIFNSNESRIKRNFRFKCRSWRIRLSPNFNYDKWVVCFNSNGYAYYDRPYYEIGILPVCTI